MLNENAINWFAHILHLLEAFFHSVHAWFMGEDPEATWPGRLVKTDSEAAKAFEGTTAAPAIEEE